MRALRLMFVEDLQFGKIGARFAVPLHLGKILHVAFRSWHARPPTCERKILRLAIFLAFLFCLPTTARAHKVNVFAYVEGGKVIVEGYFPDGRKCQNSSVEVFSEGKKILEGKTDASGRFTFQPQARTDMLIRLNASMGHQAEYEIPADELSATKAPIEAQLSQTGEASSPGAELGRPAGSAETALEAAEFSALEQMIERAVSRQVLPLRRALEKERERRHVLDVIGGVGYLIGMMGIIAYYRSKRQSNIRG